MAENYLWHKVTEEEKEEIRKKSKKMLDQFSKKLASIKGVEEHYQSSVAKNGLREEGKPWTTDPNFKDLFILNAPFVEDDFIIAEKGKWKK
jgi:predicted Asp-tRNA(Asn)/Glu-tRNA(Gln) amidotransferase subunit C